MLAVWSISRIGRTTRHVIGAVNALHRHGIDLYSHEDGLDTMTGSGKSAAVSFVPLARREQEQHRERSRISLGRAHRNGVRLGWSSNLKESVQAAIVALRERGVSIRSMVGQLRFGNSTLCKVL